MRNNLSTVCLLECSLVQPYLFTTSTINSIRRGYGLGRLLRDINWFSFSYPGKRVPVRFFPGSRDISPWYWLDRVQHKSVISCLSYAQMGKNHLVINWLIFIALCYNMKERPCWEACVFKRGFLPAGYFFKTLFSRSNHLPANPILRKRPTKSLLLWNLIRPDLHTIVFAQRNSPFFYFSHSSL